jgi:hypothetical protein
MGYFAQHAMDLLDGERTVFEELEYSHSGRAGAPRARGLSRFSGDDVEEMPGAFGRREDAACDGENAVRSVKPPGAGTSQPTISTWPRRKC